MQKIRESVLYYEGEPAIVYYFDEKLAPYEAILIQRSSSVDMNDTGPMSPEREEFEVIRRNPLYQTEVDLKRLQGALKKLKREYNAIKHLLRMTPVEEIYERHALKAAKTKLLLEGRELVEEYDRLARFYNKKTKTEKYPYTPIKKKKKSRK